MMQLVFTPRWFFVEDIAIDAVSALVSFLIVFFCVKYYKINKNKSYLWFATSFFIIALSFLFKITTNFSLYSTIWATRQIGNVTLSYYGLQASNTIFNYGFLFYRIFTLIGLFILYELYQKEHSKPDIFLIISLILIATYFGISAYYIFHLISLILLILISFRYCKKCYSNKNKTTKLLASSFIVITISQFFFIFTAVNPLFYVAAEIIQFIGYVILLITFILVLKYGKKKK